MRRRGAIGVVAAAVAAGAVVLAAVAGGAVAIQKTPVPGQQPDNTPGFGEMSSTSDGAVLFGAGDNGNKVGDQTWVYDAASNAWTNRNPTHAPSARQAHDMAPVPGTPKDAFLYGGVDAGGHPLADMWRWNGTTGDWQFVCDPCKPGPLARESMATDGTTLLLFGGSDASGFNSELWRFDPAANDWVAVSVPAPVPFPRGDAHFAFDGAAFVLYGGLANNFQSLADTWLLKPSGGGGYAWTEACSDCPPGTRALGGFAPAFGGALLVAGQRINAQASPPTLFLSDIWQWDGSAWQQVDAGVAPTASEDDPAVPYSPLLVSATGGALLVDNHSDGTNSTTQSFRITQQVPPTTTTSTTASTTTTTRASTTTSTTVPARTRPAGAVVQQPTFVG